MAAGEPAITNLQRLELDHARNDADAIADYENSRVLTTDQSKFNGKYMLRLVGAVSSVSLGTVAAYWGFSPPAAVLTYISEDIGKVSPHSSLDGTGILLTQHYYEQVALRMPVSSALSGPQLVLSPSLCSAGCPTNLAGAGS